MKINQINKLTYILPLAFILNACVSGNNKQNTQLSNPVAGNLQSNNTGTVTNNLSTRPRIQISGPKRTVSVGKFTSIGSFSSKYGQWELGGGLQAMLNKALIDTQGFVVVERANLRDVISEQQLKADGLVQQGTGPKFRQLTGAQFIIYGAVTEFGTRDQGGGLNLGIGSGPFRIGLGGQTNSGVVAFDIRVVDTTTGKIVSSHTVREEIESYGFGTSFGYRNLSLGGNRFTNTPLGQASRNAIETAVRHIANDMTSTTWKGRIVDVDGRDIYINAGQNAGVRIGDNFNIERISKQFTDPDTGEILGLQKQVLGSVLITRVEPKLAYGRYIIRSEMIPGRGDLVTAK